MHHEKALHHHDRISNGFGDINGLLIGSGISNSVHPIFSQNTSIMKPALVEHSRARTRAIASGIFQRTNFYCITNTVEDIGHKKPNRPKCCL